MNQKTKMRYTSEKGITLIALVITIIVLLILAGVTISMVLGDDGIIAQATQAGKEQNEGSIEEGITIIKGELEIEKYGGKAANLSSKTAEGIIERLVADGIAKEGELKKLSPYRIGYTDETNTKSYSLRGVLEWDNTNAAGLTIVDNVVTSWTETALEDAIIPEGVTSIGEEAFRLAEFKSIEIPDTVTSIEMGAFNNSSLENIEIPSSVTSIGHYIFGDSSLKNIKIPNSVTSIGEEAFLCCTELTTIEIPNSVESIGERAFQSCTALTTIKIPNSVTSIDEEAFLCCTELTTIEIPSSVESIGKNAFQDCTALTSIKIEKGSSLSTNSSTGYPWGIDETKASNIIKFNQTISD